MSHNKFGKMVSLELTETEKECFEGYRCYTNGRSDHNSADFHCDGDGATPVFDQKMFQIHSSDSF